MACRIVSNIVSPVKSTFMSAVINLIIKKKQNETGSEDFFLEKITHEEITLFEASGVQDILLSVEGSYVFEIHVHSTESPDGIVQKHTVIISQDESDETIKPGQFSDISSYVLPSANGRKKDKIQPTQDESDETLKPAKLPGGENPLS